MDIFDCIILDEVHERDIDMDFLFMILKSFLHKCRFKLILMSATLEAERLAMYFGENEISEDRVKYYLNFEIRDFLDRGKNKYDDFNKK